MKRLLLALAIMAFALPAARQAEARTDISIDFFYDNLGDGGNWLEVGDYGYCWQPSIAVSNHSWRPYSDGYWAYTDVGWTWVSYEDFGWATYHYGRWIRLRGRGWVWVPGREWGPAWVSWRTGGDYVGWAPLPPRRAGEYWDESPITARVDIDFDIGPAYYNFIDVRYIGEPVLRERIFAADQNVTYITKTVNVTNITYTNSTVYNYGPDVNTLSRYSTRPIQRLSLQREANVDPTAAAQSKSLMKVQGDKLVVAAPQQFQKPTTRVAPKVVKEKIAQAPVERGWEPAGDAKAQAELKQKMQKEDPKSVPPPTEPVTNKPSAAATTSGPTPSSARATATPATNVSPVTSASMTPAPSAPPTAPTAPSASVSPARDKGKDKYKRDNASPAPSSSVAASPVAPSDKGKNKRNDKAPGATPAVSAPPASVPPASAPPLTAPAPPRDTGKDKHREKAAPNTPVPPVSNATESAPTPKGPKEKPKKPDPSLIPPSQSLQSTAPAPIPPPPKQENKRNRPPSETAMPETGPEKPKRDMANEGPGKSFKKEPPAERMAPAVPPANVPANPPGRDDGKKQKKNEPATSPTP